MEIFKNVFSEKKIHFLYCEFRKIEFDDELNFEHCNTHIDELIIEIHKRFDEVELMRPQIKLFNNPMALKLILLFNYNYVSCKQFHFFFFLKKIIDSVLDNTTS